jgi:hypothetical protein
LGPIGLIPYIDALVAKEGGFRTRSKTRRRFFAELCRREGIRANLYYRWSRDFLEAGKQKKYTKDQAA